jgi:hypothetical protein
MAIRELNTRIALKYDSYENWMKDASVELLPGELAIAYLGETKTPDLYKEGTQAQKDTHPVLFKVGPGKFKDLPWASALAADVYIWAKAKTVAYNTTDKKIEFKNEAGTVVDSIDLSTLATKAVTDDLSTRLGTVETSLATGGTIEKRIDDVEGAIDVINGEGTGSIKAAAAAAQAAAETTAAADAKAKADAAEAAAKTHATNLDTAMGARVSALETFKSEQLATNSTTATAISDMDAAYKTADAQLKSNYEAADTAINNKIGAVAEGKTVVGLIGEAIESAATTAQGKVDELARTTVKANTEAIGTLNTNVGNLTTALNDEKTAREDADKALDARIKPIVAFFDSAAKDTYGEDGQKLTNALDTLVEIQDYLNGEGAAAGGIIDRVAANEKAIEDLGKADETFTNNFVTVNTNIENLSTAVSTLDDIVDGYTGKGSIAAAISGVDTKADNAASAAAEADRKAGAAQSAAEAAAQAATAAQGTANEALGKANKNIADLSSLTTRVGAAETNITNIQAIVSDAAENDTVGKLRTDVNALKTLTDDAAKGNVALYDELTRVAGLVDDETTGLAATKAIADEALGKANENATDIGNIQTSLTNYVQEADLLIFQCGDSKSVDHTKPSNN